MTFAGIFLAGVSVAIFKASDFGTDPNSCFVMGVWNLAGIKYSYVYIAINALCCWEYSFWTDILSDLELC